MPATCFVIMPFGVRTDDAGRAFSFDDLYEYLIKDTILRLDDVVPLRCDEISQSGWIHSMMIENIAAAPLAIVDISTLNPNVFYELGVRHALKPSGTVLIRRDGTESPFNIEGFNCIDYNIDSSAGRRQFEGRLREFLENACAHPDNIDSLVYDVLPDLRLEQGPAAAATPSTVLRGTHIYAHTLVNVPDKQLCLITGDWRDISQCDIWVNSENTNMQMARFYERSVSGLIRYLGATKSLAGEILEDTIANELYAQLAGAERVEKAAVIPTDPGHLAETNNVKALFHAGSVEGELGVGYRPITNIERCIRNALKMADSAQFREQQLRSILFPIMGTGNAGGQLEEMASGQLGAAVDYLESHPESCITRVYFSAFTDYTLDTLKAVVEQMPSLG